MIRKFFIFLLCFVFASCTSKQKFDQSLQVEDCDLALENIPENQTGFKLMSKTQEVSGTLLSYSAIGAAYTVQVLWDTTVTVGSLIVLCAPGLLTPQNPGVTQLMGFCRPEAVKKIQAPYLGKDMTHTTQNWSCPNVDPLSRSFRQVTQCYARKGGKRNLEKALATIQSVERSGNFYKCLSSEERALFSKEKDRVEKQIVVSSHEI